MGGLSGSSILGDSQGQGVQDPQGKTWGPDTGREGTGQRESMQAGQTRLHEPRATSTPTSTEAGRGRGLPPAVVCEHTKNHASVRTGHNPSGQQMTQANAQTAEAAVPSTPLGVRALLGLPVPRQGERNDCPVHSAPQEPRSDPRRHSTDGKTEAAPLGEVSSRCHSATQEGQGLRATAGDRPGSRGDWPSKQPYAQSALEASGASRCHPRSQACRERVRE